MPPSNDPDLRHEPALGATFSTPPDDEAGADAVIARASQHGGRDRDAALQSVFDEPFAVTRSSEPARIERDCACPACGYNLRGCVAGAACPECGRRFDENYAQWLHRHLSQSSRSAGTFAVAMAVAVAGVLAVAGTIIGTLIEQAGGGLMGLIVFGPTIEEVMKVAAVVWLLERSPWRLRGRGAVIVAAMAGALGFAVIENVIYLTVYIPDPSPGIVAWRWTVCTGLHLSATGITTVGLVRLWSRAMTHLEPVQLSMALPYLAGAIVLHGIYNALAIAMDLAKVF